MSASISTTGRPAAPIADGRLLLPGLRPYEGNRVRVEVDDLPLDAEIDTAEVEAVPYDRSGMTIDFPLRHSEQATATLLDGDGEPLPIGLRLRSADGAVTAWVARDGFSQVTGPLRARDPVSTARMAAIAVSCELPPAPEGELLPDLGVDRMPMMRARVLVRRAARRLGESGARRLQRRGRAGDVRRDRPAAPEPWHGRGRRPLRRAGHASRSGSRRGVAPATPGAWTVADGGRLDYYLFADAGHSIPWGDGEALGNPVSAASDGTAPKRLTIYGIVPAPVADRRRRVRRQPAGHAHFLDLREHRRMRP